MKVILKLAASMLLSVMLLPLVWHAADNEKEFTPSHHWLTLQIGGRERTCLLHLPPIYDGKRSLPLVIVLHGGGGNAESAERMTGFTRKADKEGFIVAYPNGTGRLKNRLLTWNSGNCCGYALDNNVDDGGFIRALMERLEKEVKADGNRIFVTGISNGGMMAYRVACELSDKVAAIAPVAGAQNVDGKPTHPVSVIIFHGTNDEHVLYEGGKPKKRADPHDRTDKSVAFAVDFWVKHNGCDAKPRRVEKGNVVTETYSGGKDGTEVTLVTIKGGNHSWPGGERLARFLDDPTREIAATDVMWEFFAKHPKRGVN
jgi:polyhydroxybutyrate depolymerase